MPSSSRNREKFSADGLPTLIGSLPLKSHEEALALIFRYTGEIPLWPQLPCRPEERMLYQFMEGIPGIEQMEEKVFFNTESETFQTELLEFFEEYLAITEAGKDLLSSRFAVSRERAPGLYLLQEKSETIDKVALKGQTTGPFTLLVGLCDQHQRLAYYDDSLREMLVKGVAMKAAWQTSFLKQASENVIVFLDEPALAGLGSSSFISIDKDDIAEQLDEVIAAIHKQKGLAGIHVCANTDWNMLLGLDLDVLSFDAYGFFDRFATCKNAVIEYLNRGGIIAWGGIPTSNTEAIEKESIESLVSLWEDHMRLLESPAFSVRDLLRQTLVTPSCGTGSVAPGPAAKVLELCSGVSAALRRKYLG